MSHAAQQPANMNQAYYQPKNDEKNFEKLDLSGKSLFHSIKIP